MGPKAWDSTFHSLSQLLLTNIELYTETGLSQWI